MNKKSEICVITTTRAEFGLLVNFIKKLSSDQNFNVTIIASGTHLVREFGYTVSEIYQENFNCKIIELPIIEKNCNTYEILAKTISVFGKHFHDNKYDCAVVLGDRFEILGVAQACLLESIPLAHISGGDVTFGAIDDCCRHAITKMSNLHFAGNEDMKNRVIQLGEQPDTVFNVGEPGVENVLKTPLMSLDEIKQSLSFENLNEKQYFVVTYHPETISKLAPLEQIKIVMDIILKHNEYSYIITKANVDNGGNEINNYIKAQVKNKDNIFFIDSLGFRRYLSCLKYCKGVLGNSSSGIIEAPYFHIPTINIGNRQEGRIQAFSIVNAEISSDSIENALKIINETRFQSQLNKNENIYGDGNTSEQIYNILKEFIIKNKLTKKKYFYDLKQN